MSKAVQAKTAFLNAPISSIADEIIIRGLDDIYDNQVAMVDDIMYGTIDPLSSENQEIISWTDIEVVDSTTVRLTGVTRGLAAQPGVAGTARAHGGNVEFILTNNPQFYDKIAFVDEAESITEAWDFEVSPTVPTPTTGQQAVPKDYADGIATAGGPDAAVLTKGLARLTVSPNVTLGTVTITIASPGVSTLNDHGLTANDTVQFTTDGDLPTGILPSTNYFVIATGLTANTFQISLTLGGAAINTSGTQSGTHTLIRTTPRAVSETDTRLPTQGENDAMAGNNTDIPVGTGNKNVTQTGLQHNAEKWAADASGSSTAYTATLAPVPTADTDGMIVYVKIGLANTTTTPTLSVNGHTARTIVKLAGTALAIGDISAGMYCTFQYDLTNTRWIMLNPVANVVDPTTVNETLELLQGVGYATTVKDYWNFSIPYNISTNVPSGDFWTYVNDLATGYNSTQYVNFTPDANSAGSLMTTTPIWVTGWNTGITFATTKKVIVEWGVELEAVGTEQQGFGLSEGNAPFSDYDDASDDAACFTVSAAGALYAHTSNGAGTTNHTETLISGITLTDLNTYRIEFDPGVDVKFYVNGILKATINTTLPNGNNILFGCGVEGKDGGNGGITMTIPYFSIEK